MSERVKVTNQEIYNAVAACGMLERSYRLHTALSMTVARVYKVLLDEQKTIEKVRNAKKDEQLEKDENGKTIKDEKGQPKFKDQEEWEKADAEILAGTVELVIAGKIKLPTKTVVACEKCRHNQETDFEVEPIIARWLLPFLDGIE